MTKLSLKIPLVRRQLEGITLTYRHWHATGFDCETAHDQLLLAHFQEMHFRLEVMYNTKPGKCTLSLSAPEAIAFLQFWTTTSIPNLYAQTCINKVIEMIDRNHKQSLLTKPNK